MILEFNHQPLWRRTLYIKASPHMEIKPKANSPARSPMGVVKPPSKGESRHRCLRCGGKAVWNPIIQQRVCYKCRRQFPLGDSVGIPTVIGRR